jgi:branched-chain amino acid transport system permease protein
MTLRWVGGLRSPDGSRSTVIDIAGVVGVFAAAYLVGSQVLPGGVPGGIVVFGVGMGMLNALGAIGLILVFRAGRYVNFAQGAIGAVGATLAFRLINIEAWNWYLAVLLGLAAAVALAGFCELLFVQRLFTASRLVMTIATIGIAQFAAFFGLLFTSLINDPTELVPTVAQPPFDISFQLGPVRFASAHILIFIVVPVVLLSLGLFLRKSRYGVAMDAGAQNVDRARLVGISVRSLSTSVWLISGLLGGLAALLSAPITNIDLGTSAGPSLLLFALAPAMIAGLESMPVAVVAAIGLGILQQTVAFNFSGSGPNQIALFAVIVITLVVRRKKLGLGGRLREAPLTMGTTTRPFPHELSHDRFLTALRASGRVAALAVAVAVPITLSLSQQHRMTVIVVFAMAALSLTILTGYAGQVSFGQWALVGFGGLFGGYLATEHGLTFVAGLVLVPLLGLALATVIGLPALALRGILLGVTTMAFSVAAATYLFNLEFFVMARFVTRPTLLGLDLSNQLVYYYVALAFLVAVFWALGRLRRSATGRNMLAVRDDSQVAAAFGIPVLRTRLIAFALSGTIAALAGYLHLYNAGQLTAGSFQPLVSLTLFSAVIIGGVGARMGAVIAALFLQGIVAFLPEILQVFTTSLGLLLVLMLLPQGISGAIIDVRDALLRYYARRRGIALSGDRAATPEGTDPPQPATVRPVGAAERVTETDAPAEVVSEAGGR